MRNAALGAFALPILGMPAGNESARTQPINSRAVAGPLQFDRILYDARRPQALAFGETARRSGARIHGISGDVDDACYEDLQRRWHVARVPVAGITDFRVLALLQAMASDAGLRPVLRIHHCGHDASMVHEAFGRSVCRGASHALLSRAGMHWGRAAACLVVSLAADGDGEMHGAAEMQGAAEMSAADLRAFDSHALVTWVIA